MVSRSTGVNWPAARWRHQPRRTTPQRQVFDAVSNVFRAMATGTKSSRLVPVAPSCGRSENTGQMGGHNCLMSILCVFLCQWEPIIQVGSSKGKNVPFLIPNRG